MENPFHPVSGKTPAVFPDREGAKQKITEGLKRLDGPYQTTIISGVYGMGKTALFAEICREIKKDKKWIVADVPSTGNILENIVQSIRIQMDSELKKALESMDGFALDETGSGFSISPVKSEIHFPSLLEIILREMKKHHKALLVGVDDVVPADSVREFVAVYQILLHKDYPFACLMSGLPENISELQNDQVLTFLLRSMRIDLPMLNPAGIQYSYQEVFSQAGKTTEPAALKQMTELTGGYPYAFQLLGDLIWETGEERITSGIIDSVLDSYRKMLFRNAWAEIFEECSQTDREFLKAMTAAGETPVSMKTICRSLEEKSDSVSASRRRLLENGIIDSPSCGHVVFSLPLFDEYIREFQMEE